MTRFIVGRLAWVGVLLFVVSLLTFVIFYLLPSADPAVLRAGRNPNPEVVAQIREQLGLDRSWPAQFGDYLQALVLHLDFGYSYNSGAPVLTEISNGCRQRSRGLARELGLTMVFIAHDLSVVRYMCDRIAVMYLGEIVELATTAQLFAHPRHPYTAALLSAVPVAYPWLAATRTRQVLAGAPPSPSDPPAGCRFHPRCPRAEPGECDVREPLLEAKPGGNLAACHFPLTDGAAAVSSSQAPPR